MTTGKVIREIPWKRVEYPIASVNGAEVLTNRLGKLSIYTPTTNELVKLADVVTHDDQSQRQVVVFQV